MIAIRPRSLAGILVLALLPGTLLAQGNVNVYSARQEALIKPLVERFTEETGIRVNIVCPGIVDTPMHHRARALLGDEVYDSAVLPNVHLRRAGQPEELARTIVFLCSDEASYVTGTTLTPDGGFTMTI